VLPWLPVVLALSANSPFEAGVDTGMLSTRAGILAELPRGGAPPVFASYPAWEAWVERLVRLGVVEDETRIWWDARPHPRLGTLEVRIADQPTAPERTELLVRLLRDLVDRAPARAADHGGRGDYLQNRWAAARYGLDAQLVHPDGDRVVGARELAAELLGQPPPEPEALRQLEVARRERGRDRGVGVGLAGELRRRARGAEPVDEAAHPLGRQRPDELVDDVAVAEGLDRRDAPDAVLGGEPLVRVDVDLDELDRAARRLHRLLEQRPERATGAAPLGPEVDEHGHLAGALDHVLLERLVGRLHAPQG